MGDSRFNGMRLAVDAKDAAFIACDSMNYGWLINGSNKCRPSTSAISQVNNKIQNSDHNIIINLGVNDMGNVSNYYKKYTELAKGEWKDYDIYIVSVNPINDSLAKKSGYMAINDNVVKFNDKMKSIASESSNLHYCNTYSVIVDEVKSGNGTVDGIHYNIDTYKKIYNYIVDDCIKK